jgi:hypothetical protein
MLWINTQSAPSAPSAPSAGATECRGGRRGLPEAALSINDLPAAVLCIMYMFYTRIKASKLCNKYYLCMAYIREEPAIATTASPIAVIRDWGCSWGQG